MSEQNYPPSDQVSREKDWNELEFVPWRSFQRMAPSILTLEMSRLAELIREASSIDFRNALVKVRFELGAFVDELRDEKDPVNLATTNLQAAIVNLPLDYPGLDPNTAATLEYILDRLEYVHNRIRFVYQ